MIWSYLFNAIRNAFGLLLPFQIPQFSQENIDLIYSYFTDYIFQGFEIFGFFFPLPLIKVLFTIFAIASAAELTYYVVLWAMEKIPLADIH